MDRLSPATKNRGEDETIFRFANIIKGRGIKVAIN